MTGIRVSSWYSVIWARAFVCGCGDSMIGYTFTYQAAAEMLGMVKLELTPSEYLVRNFTVITSGMADHSALAFCLERLGEDSIMFAIDYPYEDGTTATEFLRTAEITEAQRSKISHRNAERLFRIPTTRQELDDL